MKNSISRVPHVDNIVYLPEMRSQARTGGFENDSCYVVFFRNSDFDFLVGSYVLFSVLDGDNGDKIARVVNKRDSGGRRSRGGSDTDQLLDFLRAGGQFYTCHKVRKLAVLKGMKVMSGALFD